MGRLMGREPSGSGGANGGWVTGRDGAQAGVGAGPGRPELTVEEAGLGSGVAFGVAIPSPAQLLAVEEVPEPGAGVQAVPVGWDTGAQPHPGPGPWPLREVALAMPGPHSSTPVATPEAAHLYRHLLCAYSLPCSVPRPRWTNGTDAP